MKIERYSTGVKIIDPTPEMRSVVMKYFSLVNPPREYFIYYNTPDEEAIYIPSGFMNINDNYIQASRRLIEQKSAYEGADIPSLNMALEPRSRLQRDCIDKLTKSYSSKITVEVKPGVGKMEPYTRKIPTPTPEGYTLMGDLKVGDYVFDRHGKPSQILQIFEQGVQDVYEVEFLDGRTAVCGAQHLWTVLNTDTLVWETITLETIMNNFRRYKYCIPMCDCVEYPDVKTYVDPWVFGCFVNGGILTSQELTLVSNNPSIPNKIAQMCNMVAIREGVSSTYTFARKNDGAKILTSEFFLDIFTDEDEYDKFIHKVSIPSKYRINSANVRCDFLRGYIDMNYINDSYVSDLSRPKVKCENSNLLYELYWMLHSIGCSITNTFKTSAGYYFEINVDKDFLPKIFSIGAVVGAEYEYAGNNKILSIVDIRKQEPTQCRCIMVDNPEHLYLTEDFIVTHNTFIALYAIAKLQRKALIICPTTNLKDQWTQQLISMGVGRKAISDTIWQSKDKPFTVTTISALERGMKERWWNLRQMIDAAGFGIKIVDEAHLHLKGVMKLDSICNIKRNWYLSATLGRSAKDEDDILHRALLDADRFIGTTQYDEYQHQYVNLYFQDVYYYPSAKLCDETLKMGTKGLIRSTYYNMLLEYKNGVPFLSNIIIMIKRAKYISKVGKILILVPLHEIIDRLIKAISVDPFFNGLKVGYVTGDVNKHVKPEMMDCDVILSTAQSMGTGVDVQNLAAVINYDQFSSPIINEQIVGRLRDRGKETFFFDVCDHVKYAKSVERWGMKRRAIMPYFPGVKPNIHTLEPIHS